MQKMHLPRGAIEQKMRAEGRSEADIAEFFGAYVRRVLEPPRGLEGGPRPRVGQPGREARVRVEGHEPERLEGQRHARRRQHGRGDVADAVPREHAPPQ